MTTTQDAPTGTTYLAMRPEQKTFDELQVSALRQLGVENATPADLAVFFHQSRRSGLDPFSKQIYMIGRYTKSGVKWTIQAAIDGLRLVAERTGKYEGQTDPEWCGEDGVWKEAWIGHGPPVAARIGVYREGFRAPVRAVALYDEYVQVDRAGDPTQMWKKMPANQLAKCAEALALRKAFPHDLGGLYVEEEMGQATHATPEGTEEQGAKLRAAAEAAGIKTKAEQAATDAEEVVDGEVIEEQPASAEPAAEAAQEPADGADWPEVAKPGAKK